MEHPEQRQVQQDELSTPMAPTPEPLSTPLALPSAAIDYPAGFGKDTFKDIGWVHQSSLNYSNSANFTKITWISTKMSSLDYNLTH